VNDEATLAERTRSPASLLPGDDVVRFVHELRFGALPQDVIAQASRCLLDLIGVAAAGSRTRMSRIARAYAVSDMNGSARRSRILFDGRPCSAAGATFAGATTIDAIDAHDGHALTKGHAGVAVLPALLALCDLQSDDAPSINAHEFLTCLVLGYEIGTRAGIALHASASDYHCSGAWSAMACAAVAARVLRFDVCKTREALGIAEYFAPRGQMLRTCEHPSMVKDGSGWGAHAGIAAAWLARDGFTGAPAVLIEDASTREHWRDLGTRWCIREQYFKPHAVCRWAQPAIEAVLNLQRTHGFVLQDVARIDIETFREAVALGSAVSMPATTEEAQYSLAYPVAAALVFGRVGADEVDAAALADERIRPIVECIRLTEDRAWSQRFPAERWARATIALRDGRVLRSDPAQARGDPDRPLADDELRDKYFAFATPVLGRVRAERIERLVGALPQGGSIAALLSELLRAA
jgi:2-methylcitrate dehydratase PrpD